MRLVPLGPLVGMFPLIFPIQCIICTADHTLRLPFTNSKQKPLFITGAAQVVRQNVHNGLLPGDNNHCPCCIAIKGLNSLQKSGKANALPGLTMLPLIIESYTVHAGGLHITKISLACDGNIIELKPAVATLVQRKHLVAHNSFICS